MRYVRNPQMKLGEVDIGDIEIDTKSRDDIPALLLGLQHLYKDKTLRSRLFALLERHILPGTDRRVGRPGMEMWRILVMGVMKQGLGCDFDRLQELVNHHDTIRQFLGHPDVWDKHHYEYQNLVDNVELLGPELLAEVNSLIVESGHAVARKKPGAPLAGRCDSFVVKTDVRHPTDVSLLWDAVRCMVRETAGAATEHDVGNWRQWRHLTEGVRQRFLRVRVTGRAQPDDVEGCLALCRRLVLRAEGTLPELEARGVNISTLDTIHNYMSHAVRQIDQVDRRLLRGETIPHGEKVFSVFRPHTRWISKGKAGCPVELGVPVCVVEDHEGFILNHAVMWEGGDTDHAVPVVRAALARFPNLRAVSFDRGFHSPANRAILDELLGVNALPKKGYLGKVDRERESEREFAAMRKKHPGVESCINNLGHRGLDLVRAHGADGFARAVSLSVIAPTCTGSGLSCARGRGSGAGAPPDGLPLPAKRGVPDRPKGPEGPPLRARQLCMEYSMYKRFRDSAGRPPRRCPGAGIGRKPEPGRAKTGGFLADTM